MENMVERLKKLKSRGFTEDYIITEDGRIKDSKGKVYPLSEVRLESSYRIEGDSDPMNQSVIYAISCKNNESRGVLINSYGTYSEPEKDEVIQTIEKASS